MKIKIQPIVIVEGKYDKIKLSSILDTLIIQTDGFEVFNNKELQKQIRVLSSKNGAIILTDSDRAGFKIRKFLHVLLRDAEIYDLYIPDVYGKERRKTEYSAEMKLGVEGMPIELLREKFKSIDLLKKVNDNRLTEVDLYECGLFGGSLSADKRRQLQSMLNLPGRLNKNMLLRVLNTLFTKEQFITFVTDINKRDPLLK